VAPGRPSVVVGVLDGGDTGEFIPATAGKPSTHRCLPVGGGGGGGGCWCGWWWMMGTLLSPEETTTARMRVVVLSARHGLCNIPAGAGPLVGVGGGDGVVVVGCGLVVG
jgi:hypothetical protein